jgi:riboflavin kinase
MISLMPLLRGKICGGKGDFARWIALLHDHYRRKTGLDLFPGTLNVRLDQPYHVPNNVLRLEPHEYGGTVGVNLVPCRIFGRMAFILRTDPNERGDGDHPLNIIEIATDIKLRDVWSLTDGDTVEIEI